MKVAILSDIHFGIRLDSQILLHHFFKFFHRIFLPRLEKEKIDTIVIAGDLYDRRKYININTAFQINHNFWVSLSGKTILALAGNHDVYHTNTIKVNSLETLTPSYLNLDYKTFVQPKELVLGGILCLVLPWICDENRENCLKAIQETKAQICFGHLHLKGFEMGAGTICQDGMDSNIFRKFDIVLTGHFHHHQRKDNIHYLGAPYQMIWEDWNSPRGFHIFDLDSRQLEFIPNPYEIFHKVVYDDLDALEVLDKDWDSFQDTYVKVIVKNKINPYFFDVFIDNLEKYAADVKIIETKEIALENVSVIGDLNTLSLLKKCVEESDVNVDKNKLDNFMSCLYSEAQKIEA